MAKTLWKRLGFTFDDDDIYIKSTRVWLSDKYRRKVGKNSITAARNDLTYLDSYKLERVNNQETAFLVNEKGSNHKGINGSVRHPGQDTLRQYAISASCWPASAIWLCR